MRGPEIPLNLEDHESEPRMNFGRFFLINGALIAGAIAIFWLVAPGVFRSELAQPGQIVLWTFLFGLPLSLFEYLYHRYLLHSAVLPFLGDMHNAHAEHHGLTSVKAPVTPHEPTKLVPVKNEYPVEHEHQEESMMFPWFALPIFYLVFMLLLGLPFKLMFPASPVLFSVILVVSLFYCAYELWHAVLHLPFDRFWQPLMDGKRTGRVVRYVYSFHLMHHWRPVANLAVVGFWGVALWDHVFRTHHRPGRLPLKGAEVAFTDADMKKPLWPIRTMDRWQAALYKWSRKVEKTVGGIFRKRASQAGK